MMIFAGSLQLQMRRSTLDRVSAIATPMGASLPRYRRTRTNGRRRHRLKSSRSLWSGLCGGASPDAWNVYMPSVASLYLLCLPVLLRRTR